MGNTASMYRYVCLSVIALALWSTIGNATVSVNLPLDDPAYPLLEKLVTAGLTFRNALTTKPITRLYAARLVAEAIQQRRQEVQTDQRPEPFLDDTLQYLARRFRQELRSIGFLYQPFRPGPFTLVPLEEIKLNLVGAYQQFVQRDRRGQTQNFQGVFGLNEGFIPGDALSIRLRTASWGTLWQHLAVYTEPEVIVRSDPLFGDSFTGNLHKGYLKVDYTNVELTVGRDTLWWGPASQGDLILSPNAPPLDQLKLTTPMPFRLPWVYSDLGEWQITYVIAHLGETAAVPHALLSSLRITFQPASFLQFGFTNALQAYGEGGVSIGALDFVPKHFIPSLEATERSINGLAAYDVVFSVPWVRQLAFLKGAKVYWQRGLDNTRSVQGVLGGGNILGGVLDGGRWDMRIEYAETRDQGAAWYTHPTYQDGFAFEQFVLGHPMGGAAESLFARATYYLSPTVWVAADGRRERYGFAVQPRLTIQQRVGLEASYQFARGQRTLALWGRLEYATLDTPTAATEHMLLLQLSARWRL